MESTASGEKSPGPSEKLPRRNIIRRRSVLQHVRARGKRRSNRWCALTSEPCPPGEKARVAFLTPKHLGSAVVRNRLRRQMREIYRRFIGATEKNRYLVWSARSDAARAEFAQLKDAMLQLSAPQKSNRLGP